MISLKTKIKKNPKLIFKKVGGQVFLLDPRDSTIHTLNETAGFIWKQIKGVTKIEKIVKALCDQFEVKETQARKDVIEWLKRYLERGLVKEVG